MASTPGRGDFFYLADAFLHGRTWLTFQPGPNDVIVIDGRFYVPFAPFPAIAADAARRASSGRSNADHVRDRASTRSSPRPGSACAGCCSAGSACARLIDRPGLAILFGFSTQILWVTTRGGVWHTGHLVATILTFAALIELFGRQRAWLIGLFAGAAFLTRAPLAFAIPFYGLMLEPRPALPSTEVVGGYVRSAVRSTRLRQWVLLGLGVLPAILAVLRLQPGPVRVARGSPAMPWRRCRRSSSASARSACSRSPTSR